MQKQGQIERPQMKHGNQKKILHVDLDLEP